MKSARLFVAAALTLAATSLPSHAYNNNVRDHFYHAPLEIQILNNGPRIDDKRTQDIPGTTYVIEAPQKEAPASPVVTIRPSGAGAYIPNLQSSSPSLPPAGFRTAINPGRGGMLNNLPDGTIRNHVGTGVRGTVQNGNNAPMKIASKAPIAVHQNSQPVQQPATLSYAPISGSSGMTAMNVDTRVKAQLATPVRGSLLH